ncbi:unnamed protein product [Brassica rapa]|uniref:Uncharacterized protein n=1 Tax=Brassica campestris TaxID=3711 RepID=A0A8D9MFA5_BRACM|nr:unnamed protein product [Brassica rapa]
MVQDGGHELKEKEVGDDPDSQNKSHGRFHKMQKESTWFLVCSWLTSYPRQEEDDPLCGAMGRYLCVEAGLRRAGHEVVELLVQDTQEEDLIHCVEQWEGACV